MQVIFGFGSTEEQVRSSVKSRIMAGENVKDVLREYNDMGDKFDKMTRWEAPERYTKIWDYGNELHFHHINRNHPFSPDGWALLIVDEPFVAPQENMEESQAQHITGAVQNG